MVLRCNTMMLEAGTRWGGHFVQVTHLEVATRLEKRVSQAAKSAALIGADLASAGLAFGLSWVLSYVIRTWAGMLPLEPVSTGFTVHLAIVASFTVVLIVWFHSKGHYHRREALSDQLSAILTGTGLALLGAATVQYVTIEVGSRLLSISYWLMLAPGIVLMRMATRKALRAARLWSSPAVLFAPSSRFHEISQVISKRDELGAEIDNLIAIDAMDMAQVVAAIRAAHNRGIIAIFAPDSDSPHSEAITRQLVIEGLPFILSPRIGPVPNHAEIFNYPLEDIAFIEVRDALARPVAAAIKRAFDIAAAAFLLLALAPVLVAISLAIRNDGGPALFRQKRVGRGGAVFDCFKFRSMVLNAETKLEAIIQAEPGIAAEWKAYQKLRNDPRITPIGRFIRKANLDELPQLINVLKGDMSLVGPRPITVPQIEEYRHLISAYQRMRPGITGLWQTNGRNQTTFAERARLDAWYVRNWSLWRDFVLLVRTVREVFFFRGS